MPELPAMAWHGSGSLKCETRDRHPRIRRRISWSKRHTRRGCPPKGEFRPWFRNGTYRNGRRFVSGRKLPFSSNAILPFGVDASTDSGVDSSIARSSRRRLHCAQEDPYPISPLSPVAIGVAQLEPACCWTGWTGRVETVNGWLAGHARLGCGHGMAGEPGARGSRRR